MKHFLMVFTWSSHGQAGDGNTSVQTDRGVTIEVIRIWEAIVKGQGGYSDVTLTNLIPLDGPS